MRRLRVPSGAVALLLAVSACAKTVPPEPEVVRRAAALESYSASLRVSVRGRELRGRSRALVAFRRPACLRIEIPGAMGARLLAVARDGRLTAVLPAERAVLQQAAGAAEFEALLGVRLAPGELMDLLLGVRPAQVKDLDLRWGQALPVRLRATLADGTRLQAMVDDASASPILPDAAFEPPPHAGYRPIDADEARRLLGGR